MNNNGRCDTEIKIVTYNFAMVFFFFLNWGGGGKERYLLYLGTKMCMVNQA